jgi:hypothetical protein
MRHCIQIFFLIVFAVTNCLNAATAAAPTTAPMTFNVFRADGKLVIADQSTYKLVVQQQGSTPGLTEITQSAGTTLPQKMDMADAISTIQNTPNVTVAFITQGEEVAELTIMRDKQSYTMSVDDQYDPTRTSEYFGGILASLIPDADALLAALKPGANLTRSLTPAPAAAPAPSAQPTSAPATTQPPDPSAIHAAEVLPTPAVAPAQSPTPAPTGTAINTPPSSSSQTPNQAAPAQQSVAAPTASNTSTTDSSSSDLSKQGGATPAATPADPFDQSASTAAEYYVYLQNGSVYLTYDKLVAQGTTDTTAKNALVITRMPSPTQREFVQSNVTKAKNYFSAIQGSMNILVYLNKNAIAKIPCKGGSLIKNVIYFNKTNRDTLINDYGTAIRYLLGMDSNTQKYESILVLGKL